MHTTSSCIQSNMFIDFRAVWLNVRFQLDEHTLEQCEYAFMQEVLMPGFGLAHGIYY